MCHSDPVYVVLESGYQRSGARERQGECQNDTRDGQVLEIRWFTGTRRDPRPE